MITSVRSRSIVCRAARQIASASPAGVQIPSSPLGEDPLRQSPHVVLVLDEQHDLPVPPEALGLRLALALGASTLAGRWTLRRATPGLGIDVDNPGCR